MLNGSMACADKHDNCCFTNPQPNGTTGGVKAPTWERVPCNEGLWYVQLWQPPKCSHLILHEHQVLSCSTLWARQWPSQASGM